MIVFILTLIPKSGNSLAPLSRCYLTKLETLQSGISRKKQKQRPAVAHWSVATHVCTVDATAAATSSLPIAVELTLCTWCVATYKLIEEPSLLRLSERIIIEAVLPHFLFPPHHCADKNGFSYNVLAATHDRGLCQYDSDSICVLG